MTRCGLVNGMPKIKKTVINGDDVFGMLNKSKKVRRGIFILTLKKGNFKQNRYEHSHSVEFRRKETWKTKASPSTT